MSEQLSTADRQSYLKRIDYKGPVEPNAETLRKLHLAHLYTVPFENLSIHYSEPIVLNEASLFEKVVVRNRGGFCYELNGLFAALLSSLGYKVSKLSAQVMKGDDHYSEPFDHMVLLVELAERWVVDVGFGSSFLEPLKLVENLPQKQLNGTYQLSHDNDYWVYSSLSKEGEFQPRYRFDLNPYEFGDFMERCHFQQYSPQSHFRQSRLTTVAKPDRRITQSDLRFITTHWSGERHEVELPDEVSYQHNLQQHFGIKLESNAT